MSARQTAPSIAGVAVRTRFPYPGARRPVNHPGMGPTYRLVMGLALIVCGCGDDDAIDVAGEWCGRAVATAAECVGDEVGYLKLAQSGSRVSGKMCEAYEKDCNDLQDGAVSEARFSFFYEFAGHRVDGAFEAHGDDRLLGSLHSTKCGCDIPTTLSRVP